jgi:hypothetical protein
MQDQARALHEQVAFFTVDGGQRHAAKRAPVQDRAAHDLSFGQRAGSTADADTWAEFA